MLTWWLQGDVHFNEEDQFQQNLYLTLQAMAGDLKDKKIEIVVHKEVEPDVNVIFNTQIRTWLKLCMVKLVCMSTGKGDILFRILFSTSAGSFLEAEEAGRRLKSELEMGIYSEFGIFLSAKLVTVNLVAVQGFTVPSIEVDLIGKPVLFMMSTEDNFKMHNNFTSSEILCGLQDYSTNEVKNCLSEFYGTDQAILTPSAKLSDEAMIMTLGEGNNAEALNFYEMMNLFQ